MEITGYVYLFQCGSRYKIGTAIDVQRRMKNVQTTCHEKVVLVHAAPSDDPYRAEKFLHLMFGSKRIRNEWFDLSREDVNWILRIKSISRQYLDQYDTSTPKPTSRDAAAKRICQSCGNEFTFDTQKSHLKKYCNDECQSAYASVMSKERYKSQPYTYVPKRRPTITQTRRWEACVVCGKSLPLGLGPCCSSECALAYQVPHD
jgi:hypothetical protein